MTQCVGKELIFKVLQVDDFVEDLRSVGEEVSSRTPVDLFAAAKKLGPLSRCVVD